MKRLSLLTLAVLFACAPIVQAQVMPVTASSAAALAHFEQGLARMDNVDFVGAREHFAAAVVADPNFGLAILYEAVASPAAAREALMRRASAANISDGEHQFIDAYAAQLAGDRDEQIRLLSTLAEEFPDDPRIPQTLGVTYYNLERYDEAVAAMRQAVAIDDEFAGAYNMLGYAAMEAGDDDLAESAFRNYIRLAPNEANPHDSLGEFYMVRGRNDEAKQHFEMALEIDPDFTVSANNLARIAIERQNDRFERAVADGDGDALAELYTNTGRLLPPNEAAVNGKDAIRDYWSGFVANSGINGIELTNSEFYFADGLVTEIGAWAVSVDGEVVDSGRAMLVWGQVGDEWLMHRDMWSSERPAMTSAGN